MTEGNFTDYVKVYVRSGNGGKGSTHLHREKFVEKGGPDGGDGGRGGDIIIRGNKNLWTLINFKFQQHFRAEHGGDGGANRSTGADGKSVYLEVPLGTIVKDALTDEVLFEITQDKEEKVAPRSRDHWSPRKFLQEHHFFLWYQDGHCNPRHSPNHQLCNQRGDP